MCMHLCACMHVYGWVHAHMHALLSVVSGGCDLSLGSPRFGIAVCVCERVFCHRVVSAALIAVYLVCGLTQSLAVRSATDSPVFIGSLWPYQH